MTLTDRSQHSPGPQCQGHSLGLPEIAVQTYTRQGLRMRREVRSRELGEESRAGRGECDMRGESGQRGAGEGNVT